MNGLHEGAEAHVRRSYAGASREAQKARGTLREQQILDCFGKYHGTPQLAPTMRELAEQIGVSGPLAHRYVIRLEKKGLLIGRRRGSRKYELAVSA